MTKLVIISDTHGIERKLPDGDILIHCGDFTSNGTFHQLKQFIQWFRSQPHQYKICVAGNHDIIVQETECKYLFSDSDIIYLEDQLAIVKGLRIYGSPWTPTFFDWAFMKDRGEPIRAMWNLIPENLDVLITHGPPMGVLDVSIYSNTHVGCADLLTRVLEVKPRLHIFGHIHYGYGQIERDGIKFINACQLNEQYQPVNKPVEVELC